MFAYIISKCLPAAGGKDNKLKFLRRIDGNEECLIGRTS